MTNPGTHIYHKKQQGVLIITFDPPENIGGVEGRLSGYVRELVRTKNYVEVESFAPSHKISSFEFLGAKLHRCPSGFRHLLQTSRFTLARLREPRIQSVFLLSGGITIFGLVVLSYCRLTHRRNAILLYGKDVLQARSRILGRLLLHITTRLTGCVLTNSRFTASLLPFLPTQKIDVLYPGVDPGILALANPLSNPREKKILFVGRLIERKGAKDLVDAFRILSEDLPMARLEIVGDGPQRNLLERLVADLNLGNRVSFFGSLKGLTLFEKYTACSVFSMPSITLNDDVEGFGTVFLEAGLFGKPSVATFSGGIPEAVLNNRTGLLVREGDVPNLARALTRLLVDEELSRSLGQKARERVLDEFTWAESTKQLLRSLTKVS